MTNHDERPDRRGLAAIVVVCAAVGAAVIGATLYLGDRPAAEASAKPVIATEEYGRRLLRETPELLGQDHPDPARRMIGNRLACASCHLEIGTEPGTLTLLQTTEHYPRFSGRQGGMTDIEDRINECMQRSMNGKALPMDSPEMIAMASYLRSLGAQYAAMGAGSKKAVEPAAFKTPNRRAHVVMGHVPWQRRGGAVGDRRRAQGLPVPAALGSRQLQRRRRHGSRADRRPLHQGAHAARQARLER
jgi:hypothetical protein